MDATLNPTAEPVPHLPICASPASFFQMIDQTGALESWDGLLAATAAVSMHVGGGRKNPLDVNARLQGYADTVRSRVRTAQPQAVLAHLHAYLFDEIGFRGDADDYYRIDNCLLPAVLRRRRGLPIMLSMIYVDIARRVGLRAWGVALPGHFVAAVVDESRAAQIDGAQTAPPGTIPMEAVMLVDPFAGGRLLSRDDATVLLRLHAGEEAQLTDAMLQPVGHRQWITRVLQNLLNVYTKASRYRDVAAMLELEMVLWPGQEQLQRDLALVLARCGMSREASLWLNRYLQLHPEDPQREQLLQLLQVLLA